MTEACFEACMERMKQGDREALREIYQAYIAFIYSIVFEKLKNKENAEDITSDFFIRLWEKAALYKPGNGHRGWMATIARNMAVDFLRKNSREELADQLHSEETEPSGRAVARKVYRETESPVERDAIGSIVWKEALLSLKEQEREILNLKIMGGMTFREIASITGLPIGTVTWKYREIMKKLRRYGYEK